MPFESSRFESREQTETRQYEYKDAEGKCIARVEVRVFAERQEKRTAMWTRVESQRLASLILTNPEDGRSFDLVAECNPHEAEIWVTVERTGNYHATRGGDEALVPPPESPIDLAAMLHELGHVDQISDPAFAPLARLDRPSAPLYNESLQERLQNAKRDLEALITAVPDVEAIADPEALRALREAKTFLELDAANARLRDILALPTQMSERDATRRALLWMRRIREEAGIDLLSKTLNVKEAVTDHPPLCADYVVDALSQDADGYISVSTIDVMRRDLASYGADRFRLRKDKDGGTMPSAGRTRKTG